MKNLSINLLKLCLVWAITVFLVASCTKPSYANSVHPHGELALVSYNINGAYSPLRAFFVRNTSMRSHVMAKLEGDTFECASYLDYWSTNPFQLCHLNYLVVIGKASINSLGAHSHA